MIERHSPALSLSRQCTLLGLSRSSLYYEPALPDVATLQLRIHPAEATGY